MDNKDLIYILKSEIRFYIILSLKERMKTPKELSSNKYYITHISSNLKDLEEKDYVKCLNPKKRKNKQFTLTKKSKEILEHLHQITS